MSDSASIQILRSAAAKGSPALIISTTAQFSLLYNDSGSGAHMDVTLYRPMPQDSSYSIIGDYAQGNYSAPTGTALIVKAVNDDPDHPLLVPPVGYSEVWNDRGSGGHLDGSIWFPVPPDGYLSLGFVCNNAYSPPVIPSYRCVRRDLVVLSTAGGLIWNDSGSGAHEDVSLYAVNGSPGEFVAQGNYDPYKGVAYKLADGPR